MMKVVDSGLAGVQVWWWDPFGAAVFAFSGFPAVVGDHPVVGAAGQGFFGDVALTAIGPVLVGVVDLAPIRRRGAARAGASALGGIEHDALRRRGQAFGAPQIQRLAG
jgi:hypothetical protein